MGLFISNVDMPKNCNECKFRTTFNCHCLIGEEEGFFKDVSGYNKDKRHPDCPLVEAWRKNGRLSLSRPDDAALF